MHWWQHSICQNMLPLKASLRNIYGNLLINISFQTFFKVIIRCLYKFVIWILFLFTILQYIFYIILLQWLLVSYLEGRRKDLVRMSMLITGHLAIPYLWIPTLWKRYFIFCITKFSTKVEWTNLFFSSNDAFSNCLNIFCYTLIFNMEFNLKYYWLIIMLKNISFLMCNYNIRYWSSMYSGMFTLIICLLRNLHEFRQLLKMNVFLRSIFVENWL